MFAFFLLRNEISESFAKALNLETSSSWHKSSRKQFLLLYVKRLLMNARADQVLWSNRIEKQFACRYLQKNFHGICHQKVRYMIKSEFEKNLFFLCWNQSWCWSIRDVAFVQEKPRNRRSLEIIRMVPDKQRFNLETFSLIKFSKNAMSLNGCVCVFTWKFLTDKELL